jgi:hypothetical protein
MADAEQIKMPEPKKEGEIFQRENQRISANEILEVLLQGRQIKLYKCVISGALDVNRFFTQDESFESSKLNLVKKGQNRIITLEQEVHCNSCTFEGDVIFAPPWDRPEAVSVIFLSEIHFNSSIFNGQTRFTNSNFKKQASFDGCRFQHVACFRNTQYFDLSLFRTVAFNGYGLFSGAIFHKEARFTNTFFSKGGNFTNVVFDGKTDFSGVYSKSKSVPVYESVYFSRKGHGDDETFWRFIKQAAQEAGYYQLAGESFFNERCAHLCKKFRGVDYDELSGIRKCLRIIAGIRLLPEYIFGRLLFGYGERPIRVLVTSALVIVLCAAFYCSDYASVFSRTQDKPDIQSFMDGLYFSTITFTTLGFGDVYPATDHLLTRTVAMLEAVSGACLMSLFVVSLSKRFSRS